MRVHHPLGQREVLTAEHERVLDQLTHAGAQFVRRQRVQVARVDDVQAGGVKRPEIVLPVTDIDRGLHRWHDVVLGHQGGGHVTQAQAAIDEGRGQPAKVHGGAAAEDQDERALRRPASQTRVRQFSQD